MTKLTDQASKSFDDESKLTKSDLMEMFGLTFTVLERIACALEAQTKLMRQSMEPPIDELVVTGPDKRTPAEIERDQNDQLSPDDEDLAAMVETLEEMGVPVPAEAYKRLGLDPPERSDEPTEDELTSDQPGAESGAESGSHQNRFEDGS